MRSLIVTVAGTATRFNRDTEVETLKCLYHTGDPRLCLLYQLLSKARGCDEFVIVGGYMHDTLERFLHDHFTEFRERIKLVHNPHYSDYGSGYSLIEGVEALSPGCTEAVFAEGDLYLDTPTLQRVITSPRDVITVNSEEIMACKAVALYVDTAGHVHYLYDTSHNALYIPEPFTAVYNSGQTWKFRDPARLRAVVESLTDSQARGTNLETVQGYFGPMHTDDIEVLRFHQWYNCNTVADYHKVLAAINGDPEPACAPSDNKTI